MIGGMSLPHLILAILLLFPIIHTALSKRSSGVEKLGWVIASFLFSYLGWVVFLIATRKKKAA
tara:strand:- start:778 stop:966 length:189 start_codon:yes stop_codon:yes gene_type:complete